MNSFTRELDGIALKNLEDETMEDAVKELLGDDKPRVVLTDGGREFAACDELFDRLRIFHEVKEQGDYGAFAILDGAIGKLKRMLRVEGPEKGRTWRSQMSRVLQILNGRVNKSLGVSPASVTVDDDSKPEEKRTATLNQFRIYEHMSQNIQHNIALHKKKAAVLVEKGGARIPIPKQLDSEDPKLKRRRGPRERADDPKFGYTERLLSKTFDDGRVFTEEGSWTNMKLVVPSVPPPPPRAGVALSFMENLHIQGLFAYVLNEGPQPIREAYRFLAESGQDMRVLLSKFTFPVSLRAYAQNFRVEKDVVHLNGNFTYGQVKFRVAQQPVVRRGYQPQVVFTGSTETSYESNWPPLAFREILAEDRRYFAQRGDAQPTGFALVQRVD